MLPRAFLLLTCALFASGCTGSQSGRYGSGYQSGSPAVGLPNAGALVPTQKIAMLLPVTGPHADLGQVLAQAAELALPSDGSSPLDIIDTAGTTVGAAAAAQTAVNNHDEMILGPLTSAETASVAPIARAAGIPVLAFTNDSSQAQPGVWTLGITPDQQIGRLVAAAQEQGKTDVAALLPDSDFGHAMANALTKVAASAGLQTPSIHMHGSGMAAITSAARDLSDYANRRGPIDAKVKAARALGTAEGRRQAQDLVKTPIPPPSFNLLLLADTSESLQEIAAVLPYYDIDRSSVQVVGPALWSSPSSGSGSFSGAWYAAPDGNARMNLERDYAAKYGSPPPPLADLAFDAASLARVTVTSGRADLSALTQPAGFVGADGWFALSADGQVHRGLALFRVDRSGPALIEPAAQAAGAPGS